MGCVLTRKSKKNINVIPKEYITTVRNSWRDLNECSELPDVGLKLMIRIFTEHEELKNLWKFGVNLKNVDDMRKNSELKAHGKEVMEALGSTLNSLENKTKLDKQLFDLGVRHLDYKAKIEHFPIINTALLLTLQDTLGTKYTVDVDIAWRYIIGYFEEQMSKGMRSR